MSNLHFTPYPQEVRQSVVAMLLAGGCSIRSAARLHNVSETRAREWLKKAKKEQPITQPPPSPRPSGSVVLAIPDLHCPFEHPDALAFLKAVKERYKPDVVVCLGDEIDAHAFSRYPMDPDGLSAGQELRAAIEHLRGFYALFPNVLVCESNHTVRPWKKMFEAGLPAAFLPTYSAILQAPDGWRWKGYWDIDGVRYMHGDAGKSGQYAHVNYMKALKGSVVIGHIHSYAAVNYEGPHFGMNAGCLIDEAAYCFNYAKNMPVRVNLGCGLILKGKQAFFIPMLLNNEGRWIGRLYA